MNWVGYYDRALAASGRRASHSINEDIDPRDRDWREEGFKLMRPDTPAGRIFDVLSRGNYGMANWGLEQVKSARGEAPEWLDPEAQRKFATIPAPIRYIARSNISALRGLLGKDKVFWEDVLNEADATRKWPTGVKTAVGLAGDIGLDPLTFLTGGVTKAGKGAKVAAAGQKAGRLTTTGLEMADLTGKSLKKARKASKLIGKAAKGTGKSADELAALWAKGKPAQADAGLRGLLNFFGQPVVSGAAQQRWAERVPYWLAKTPYEDVIKSSKVYSGIERNAPGVRRGLSEVLSAFTPGNTLDPIVRPIAQQAKRAGMVKEAKLGQLLEDMAKPMRKTAEASGDPAAWVRKFMQTAERPMGAGSALKDELAKIERKITALRKPETIRWLNEAEKAGKLDDALRMFDDPAWDATSMPASRKPIGPGQLGADPNIKTFGSLADEQLEALRAKNLGLGPDRVGEFDPTGTRRAWKPSVPDEVVDVAPEHGWTPRKPKPYPRTPSKYTAEQNLASKATKLEFRRAQLIDKMGNTAITDAIAGAGIPADIEPFFGAYRSFFDKAEEITRTVRRELGLPFKTLDAPGLEYVQRIVNPDAIAEAEKVAGQAGQDVIRKFRQWSTYDSAQQQRMIRGLLGSDVNLTGIEINDIVMGRKAGLDAGNVMGDAFKGYVFKNPLFIEDPMAAVAAKAQNVGRLIRTKEYVKGVKGQLVKETPELIQQGWRTPDLRLAAQWGEGAQIPLTGFVGPRELVDNIEHVWRVANDPRTAGEVIKIYDKVLNTWRGYALMAPSYHVRNTFSNVWQNFLAGVNDPMAYREAQKFQWAVHKRSKDGGKALSEFVLATPFGDRTGVQLFDELFNEDLMGGFMSEWAREIDHMHQSLEFGHKFKHGEEKLRKLNMAAGTHIENNARFALYFDALGKGAAPQEAAGMVRKYLFDYTATGLSAFEEAKVKRVTSFYRWTKNNMLLSTEQLFKQPGKYAGIAKVKHGIEELTAEGSPSEEFLPEWLAEGYPVRIAGGEVPTYFSMQNWLPAMQVAELFEDIDEHHVPGLSWAMGLLAPTIGIPLEQAINKSFFFEDEIQQFPGERRDFLGTPMSPRLAHILRAVRPLSEANRFMRGTHPGRAASELAVGKVYPYDYQKEARNAKYRRSERLGELKAAWKRAVRKGQTREAERLKRLYLETKKTRNVQ